MIQDKPYKSIHNENAAYPFNKFLISYDSLNEFSVYYARYIDDRLAHIDHYEIHFGAVEISLYDSTTIISMAGEEILDFEIKIPITDFVKIIKSPFDLNTDPLDFMSYDKSDFVIEYDAEWIRTKIVSLEKLKAFV